jgi:hypothetical protein
MSLLLYGVVECAPGLVTGSVGVADQPLTAIDGGGLVALVSEHDETPAPTEDTLWSYEQVLEEQMARAALLPARFGSLFAEVEPIKTALRERRPEFEAGFDRVRGAVELAVRVTLQAPANEEVPPGSGGGREYLMARVRRSQAAGELRSTLQSWLDPLARASRYGTSAQLAQALTAAYLVDRERVREFTRRVTELQDHLGPVGLSCTGPWPPYSFAGGREDG